MALKSRLKNVFDVFKTQNTEYVSSYGGSYYRPDKHMLSYSNNHTIVTSVYNRIALDVAALKFRHVQLDQNGRYEHDVDTALNDCLSLAANIDQTARAFIQDVVLSCIDEGCVAIVPAETNANVMLTESYDIYALRVGKITQWYPEYVRVKLYNAQNGEKEEVTLPKSVVAIVENPFYAIMNEPNSTLQRLLRKLSILDSVDEQINSNKL
ncbi:hypothetical protein, partial [Staphylococcus aureus]